MNGGLSNTWWLIARLRREQGRTAVRPVSHRPVRGRHG